MNAFLLILELTALSRYTRQIVQALKTENRTKIFEIFQVLKIICLNTFFISFKIIAHLQILFNSYFFGLILFGEEFLTDRGTQKYKICLD